MLVNITLLAFTQKSTVAPYYQDARNMTIPYMQPNNTVHSPAAYNEVILGTTYWDLQSSNSAPPNRFYVYEDGRMGVVWTMGNDVDNNYLDRGTGYAFFDGAAWSTAPTERIETERTGWPSYAPAGTGEIVAAHHNSQGIVINRRDTIGMGEWQEYLVPNPDTTMTTYLSWPRLVSSGEDRMMVHMLVNTYEPYDSLNPAILYYRSMDGGVTWETQARVIEGMTSNEYSGLNTETYAWAEPMDSMLAFVVADRWTDLFIMRSNDNGNTWTKTIVWEHPYPMWNNTATDTFYSPDGAASLAFDTDGKLHLAFGINRTFWGDSATTAGWYPFVDGIAYWNEDMTAWTGGDMDALNPDNLEESGNLAAEMEDLNGDGQIELIGTNFQNLGLYYVGLSSMPQLAVDAAENTIYLVWSGVAEGYDDGSQMFRHIFARASEDGGETWTEIVDLTADSTQTMNESVYPMLAPMIDENLHIVYMSDNEPGLSTLGDMDAPTVNNIVYMQVPKAVIVSNEYVVNPGFSISQNYPNPFKGTTTFAMTLEKSSSVSLMIHDITGRLVMSIPQKHYTAGNHTLQINAGNLTRGLYTYTFIINGQNISNKLIVK